MNTAWSTYRLSSVSPNKQVLTQDQSIGTDEVEMNLSQSANHTRREMDVQTEPMKTEPIKQDVTVQIEDEQMSQQSSLLLHDVLPNTIPGQHFQQSIPSFLPPPPITVPHSHPVPISQPFIPAPSAPFVPFASPDPQFIPVSASHPHMMHHTSQSTGRLSPTSLQRLFKSEFQMLDTLQEQKLNIQTLSSEMMLNVVEQEVTELKRGLEEQQQLNQQHQQQQNHFYHETQRIDSIREQQKLQLEETNRQLAAQMEQVKREADEALAAVKKQVEETKQAHKETRMKYKQKLALEQVKHETEEVD